MQTFNSGGDNKNRFGDAIFSPIKHGETTSQKPSPYTRKDPLDGEIGVFGAEKYFNDEGEVEATTNYLDHQRDHQIPLQTRNYKVQYGTPSIRSESSTSNSQSALLYRSAMKNSPMNNKKIKARGFLSGFGLRCSCSDKDSVDTSKPVIDDVFHGKATLKRVFSVGPDSSNHSVKDVYFPPKQGKFPFSPVNSGLANHLVKMQLQLEQEQEEEEPRKSIAVFGSPIMSNKSKKFTINPSMGHFSAKSGSNYINDAASDASSDLFEIESLKGGKPNNTTLLARQATSGCASPTNGYAPSEVSIDWSVVTASAAVLSDCDDEKMSEVTIRSPIKTQFNKSSANGKTREVQRRCPGILLGGCKSHKALRVAGDAFITYEKPSSNNSSPKSCHRSNATSQVARFPAGARHGAYGATPSPMQHSHSSHASQLLYK